MAAPPPRRRRCAGPDVDRDLRRGARPPVRRRAPAPVGDVRRGRLRARLRRQLQERESSVLLHDVPEPRQGHRLPPAPRRSPGLIVGAATAAIAAWFLGSNRCASRCGCSEASTSSSTVVPVERRRPRPPGSVPPRQAARAGAGPPAASRAGHRRALARRPARVGRQPAAQGGALRPQGDRRRRRASCSAGETVALFPDADLDVDVERFDALAACRPGVR